MKRQEKMDQLFEAIKQLGWIIIIDETQDGSISTGALQIKILDKFYQVEIQWTDYNSLLEEIKWIDNITFPSYYSSQEQQEVQNKLIELVALVNEYESEVE